MFMKVITNSLIKLFEVTFAKLGVMHPSIMTTIKNYNQLKALKKSIKEEQLPIDINLENTPKINKN